MGVAIGGSKFFQKADHYGDYSITKVPSSPHGCTLSVSGPTGFCYRGGFLILANCAFSPDQRLRINWTLLEDDDPKLVIHSPDGRTTKSEAISYHVPR